MDGWKMVERREIVRARLLDTLRQAFQRLPDLPTLLLDTTLRAARD